MIRKAELNDAKIIAKMHKECIPSGFLSTLNHKFLTILYEFIITTETGYVYEDEGAVQGFITGAADTKKLYKSFINKNWFRSVPIIMRKLFSCVFIKRLFETVLIPFRVHKCGSEPALPELLSMAVLEGTRFHGIGTELVKELEKELIRRGFKSYEVVAGDNLTAANNFYLKNGFVLYKKIELHKGHFSNILRKNLKGEDA